MLTEITHIQKMRIGGCKLKNSGPYIYALGFDNKDQREGKQKLEQELRRTYLIKTRDCFYSNLNLLVWERLVKCCFRRKMFIVI